MNKFLHFVIIVSGLVFSVSAEARNVSTEPSNKTVLIEEYTGIHCPNCPDGHARAAAYMRAHPDQIYSVAIHAGSFATPANREPDFITPDGTEIHDYFDIGSYPSGVVNRVDVGNGIVQGRSIWGSSAREIIKQQSPVNLWAEAKYDAETRNLQINVEGYYTESMTNPCLTVMLLQNNILGPQSGGQLGIEYPHRHMLRDVLSDNAFGDPIAEKNSGEFFSRTIDYILPDAINDIPVEPSDMAIIVFVSEGKGEIMKVTECYPDIDADSYPRKIFVPAPPHIAIGNNYAFDYLEYWFDNYSGSELTSASATFILNGIKHELSWTGSIPAHESGLARFPLNGIMKDAYDPDSSTYSFMVNEANGSPLELEMLPYKGSFRNIVSYPSELTVKIKTDADAADNTYRILDENGETVVEFGPYPAGEATEYTETASLVPGTVYCLEVTDAWGDGIYHPRGSVKLYDTDGKIAGQLMEIDGFGMRSFFRATNNTGVAEVSQDAVSVTYFDLTGYEVRQPQSGIFISRTLQSNGKIKVEKVILK